jgi:hypothetical protein
VIPYNQIIDRLEKCCIERDLGKVYRGLELSEEFTKDVALAKTKGTEFFVDPMLPVDLLAVKVVDEPESEERKPEKAHHYTLFWYTLTKGLPVEILEERLRFYQFHLSRVVDLRDVKIIVVISTEMSSEFESKLQKMTDENGFGLWKFQETGTLPLIICEPCNFREHMEKIIIHPPSRMEPLPKSVKDEAPKIGLYLDRFVREAVDALAGRTPMRVGKRYIDRQILDLTFSLDKICYADRLKELVTNHLQEKGDDFEFVNTAFSELWKEYFPKIDYSQFLKKAELPLYNIFTTRERPYRDHYLHQFQVFILGSCIIDKLMSKHSGINKCPNIDKQWLITSSFHDVAYPLQLYDKWSKDFFEESLGIPDIGVSDIKSYFVDKSLLSSLGFIINALCERHFDGPLVGNWLDKERGLLLFLYDRITKLKHHCILSSIFLLKQAQVQSPEIVDELFVPSALAIALHHYDQIFNKLGLEDNAWTNLPKNRKLQTIDFATNPLAFLLMFCDCAQEWGRPKFGNKPRAELEDGQTFVLNNCSITDNQCSIRIVSPKWESTDEDFVYKNNEILNLKKMLRCPKNFDFRITLVDKSGDESRHHFKCSN